MRIVKQHKLGTVADPPALPITATASDAYIAWAKHGVTG